MQEAATILFCEKAIMDNSINPPQYSFKNVLPALCPVSIPSNFTFVIACTIFNLDLAKKNSLRVTFGPADNKNLFSTETINICTPENVNNTSIQFVLEMHNYILDSAGEYTVALYVNDSVIKEQSIPIIPLK